MQLLAEARTSAPSWVRAARSISKMQICDGNLRAMATGVRTGHKQVTFEASFDSFKRMIMAAPRGRAHGHAGTCAGTDAQRRRVSCMHHLLPGGRRSDNKFQLTQGCFMAAGRRKCNVGRTHEGVHAQLYANLWKVSETASLCQESTASNTASVGCKVSDICAKSAFEDVPLLTCKR